ncbi:MAG: hypothetical protein MUF64_29950 [Polyangiaceae bacterium]|nr:hypothetical protein [Polyangiaceae bacterium]
MPRFDMMQLLEAEMRLERTSALARLGDRLQKAIDETRALAERLRDEPPGEQRLRLLQQHQEARQRADRDRFYLIVQREALGLTEHAVVDEIYPLPPAAR